MQLSRAPRIFTLAAASLLAAATLTGCGGSSDDNALPEPTLDASAVQESDGQASDSKSETSEETPSEEKETSESKKAAQDEYTDVDPSKFEYGIVGLDSGVLGCTVSTVEGETPVFCQVNFASPLPPVEHNGGATGIDVPNVAWYKPDRGGFITAVSPGSQGYMNPPTPLNKGERVTIGDAKITHMHDSGIRVEYADDAFEVHDGVYHRPGKTQSISEENSVSKGQQCGTMNMNGMEIGVYALEDGTTCDVAMNTVAAYDKALDSGETEGQISAWTNKKTGWGCFARYVLDGQKDLPENRRVACSDSDRRGDPATEGSGGVVLLDPSEADLLQN